jgi:hypothetical protein
LRISLLRVRNTRKDVEENGGIGMYRMLMFGIDWTEEETQIPNGSTHLWEESWDDDDTNDDFAVQLR